MTEETKSKKQDLRERREQLNDLIAVMDTPQGRRFVWRVLEQARVFGSVYAQQSNQTFFNEGQRNLGLWVMNEVLDAKPELYLLMQKEHYVKRLSAEPAKDGNDA